MGRVAAGPDLVEGCRNADADTRRPWDGLLRAALLVVAAELSLRPAPAPVYP